MEVSSDHSLSLKPNPDEDDALSTQLTSEASKKRKVLQKTVVTVKIGSKKAAMVGKLKNEGPPPDFWSWRKYGQKPIKGSPYPRGYYRCSTTKGCSAKKQVERCKTDGSMFIITYTSSHNHPGPSISTLSLDKKPEEIIQPQPSDQDQDLLPNQGQDKQDQDHDHDDEKHSIPSDGEEEVEQEEEEEEGPLAMEVEEEEKPMKKIRECLDEEPVSSSCSHQLLNKSEENDFFDELEELPTPPPLSSSFMRSYFFDEIRIPAAPS